MFELLNQKANSMGATRGVDGIAPISNEVAPMQPSSALVWWELRTVWTRTFSATKNARKNFDV